MEQEVTQPVTPVKRIVDILVDENGNPKEGEVSKKTLTFESIDMPTYDEVVGKTLPDYDDFDVLRGQMGACDELAEFTKVFYYKVKVDPPVNGKDYRIEQLPKYPKFLALFEGKKTINEITLFDVNNKFNKEEFEEAIQEDEFKNNLAEAAVEIMKNMKKEQRFSFDAELKESDLVILKKWINDTDNFTTYRDLLSDSFCDMLPDFAELGKSCESPIDFNVGANVLFAPQVDEGEECACEEEETPTNDLGSFMPTAGGGWNVEEN